MNKNKILARMREGRPATGCQLAFPSAVLVELMGVAGLDFLLIDGEHGTFSWEDIDDLCRVAELADLTTIARVPNIEPSTILRYIDRGVQGILGPGVDTREDAQTLADACLYAPEGKRGLGGAARSSGYATIASREYIEQSNEEMFVAAFLEHEEAVENLDEILEVDGIDAYYVGPQDMSVSLGLIGEPDHPRVKEMDARVRGAVEAKGKRYLGSDLIVADRASNFFLNGISAFLAEKGMA